MTGYWLAKCVCGWKSTFAYLFRGEADRHALAHEHNSNFHYVTVKCSCGWETSRSLPSKRLGINSHIAKAVKHSASVEVNDGEKDNRSSVYPEGNTAKREEI